MGDFWYLIRTLVAFVVGLFAGFAFVIGVELLSNAIHPLPSDFSGKQEE